MSKPSPELIPAGSGRGRSIRAPSADQPCAEQRKVVQQPTAITNEALQHALHHVQISDSAKLALQELLAGDSSSFRSASNGTPAAEAGSAGHDTSAAGSPDSTSAVHAEEDPTAQLLRRLAAQGFTLNPPTSPDAASATRASPLQRGALAATATSGAAAERGRNGEGPVAPATKATARTTATPGSCAGPSAHNSSSDPSGDSGAKGSAHAAPQRHGVRVLSVDGGGVRGMAVIEIVRKLEFEAGLPLREMFDLVVGVSTGAFLAGLLTAGKRTLPQAAELYEDMRERMGSVPPLLQQLKRVTIGHSHSTEGAREFMQQAFGDGPMMRDGNDGPMFAAVATNVDVDPAQPHLFRSYALSPEAQARSLIRGSSDTKLWAGVRASTSAPTYYKPEEIDGVRYVDGGVTANNPSLLAVAEAHALWPGRPIDLVVSIGTGEPVKRKTGPLGSVLDWMHVVFMTSLGSHMQHYLAHSLLPQGVYFRLDPADIGEVLMSESDERKLSDMIQLTQLWCHTNHDRFAAIADIVHPTRTRRGQPAPAVWPPEGDFRQRVARVADAPPLKVPAQCDRVAQHVSADANTSKRATLPAQRPAEADAHAPTPSGDAPPHAQQTSNSPSSEPVKQHAHTTFQMRPAALAVAAVAAMSHNSASHTPTTAAGACEGAAEHRDTYQGTAHTSASAPPPAVPPQVLQRSLAPFAPPRTPGRGHAASEQSNSPADTPHQAPPSRLGPLSRDMGLKTHAGPREEGRQPPPQRTGAPAPSAADAHTRYDSNGAAVGKEPAGAGALVAEGNASLRLTPAEAAAVQEGARQAPEAKAGWMPNPYQG